MNVDLESLAEATSGAIGSLISTTILYPLDTCKTKYQAEARSSGRTKYRFNPYPSFSISLVIIDFQFVLVSCPLVDGDENLKIKNVFFFVCSYHNWVFLDRDFVLWCYVEEMVIVDQPHV